MPVCEGCGKVGTWGCLNIHRIKCAPYLEWSKQLPFACACGRHFQSERALHSHKRGCSDPEERERPVVKIRPGGRKCGCGQTYWSIVEHRKVCPGIPEVGIPLGVVPANPWSCVCGKDYSKRKVAASLGKHKQAFPLWQAYQKTLPVKCEGCGTGFNDSLEKRGHAQFCAAWQQWKKEKDEEEKVFPCPSCGELMRGLQLGLHVNSCKGPWTKADWEMHRRQSYNKRTALRNPELKVGEDFIYCLICGDKFRQLSVHVLSQHGMSLEDYHYKFGGAVISVRSSNKRKATMVSRYGAETPLQNPEISKRAEAKRRKTNQERYGGDSPFSGGLITPPKKNKLEAKVEMLAPNNVVYVGISSTGFSVRILPGNGLTGIRIS